MKTNIDFELKKAKNTIGFFGYCQATSSVTINYSVVYSKS